MTATAGTSHDLAACLVAKAEALMVLAARCDAMCLTTGTRLGEAVPGLFDISSQCIALSAMLVEEGETTPAQSLEAVSHDLTAIGRALTDEIEAVADVIVINAVLTRRIDDLADNVRYLSSVISNVKIEIAAINESDLRLEGFANNLKQLASKSEATVKAFQATHQTLVRQLQRTSAAQSAFVTSHGLSFAAAANEISISLAAVSDRRKAVSLVAGEIGDITQKMGAQIAACVVGLQIGDSARQRLEHASDGFLTAAEISSDIDRYGLFAAEAVDDDPAARDRLVARVRLLQVLQTTETTTSLSNEIHRTAQLIGQIADGADVLLNKSRTLVSSRANEANAYLADLEAKLAFAGNLIDACGRSRKLVDETAEQVIASVLDLKGFADDVATMGTDMMIIGTNAMVTSYRLGTRGIPLSVIAQHLRNHAVLVTDAIGLVSPALDKVLDAAKRFNAIRQGRDADSMETLSTRVMAALAALQAGDHAVAEVQGRLEAGVSGVSGVLRQTSDALRQIDDIEIELLSISEHADMPAAPAGFDERAALPPALDEVLRKRYTMGAERTIHDTLFPSPACVDGPASTPQAEAASDESLWL